MQQVATAMLWAQVLIYHYVSKYQESKCSLHK
jgi:hypothetical protein